MRSDVPPLPIAELASLRFETTDPDEPFRLCAGSVRATGLCRLALHGARRDDAADFSTTADASVHTLITPCGAVTTARMNGLQVTQRIAIAGAAVVAQWTVDGDAEIDVPEYGRFRLDAGQTATRILHGSADRDVMRRFRTTASDIERAIRHGLRLETSDAAGTALDWAKARHAAHGRHRTEPSLPTSLATLAIGEADPVKASLHHASAELLPILAARYAAWTGDPQSLHAFRDRLRDAVESSTATAPPDDLVAVIRLAGLVELDRTATDLGDHGFAAELRARAKAVRHALQNRASHPDAASILAALRITAPPGTAALPGATTARGGTTPPGTPQAPEAPIDDVARHAWRTWAALEQGWVDAGHAGWSRLLHEARQPLRGAWPRRFDAAGESDLDDPVATALFVNTLVYGLLGIEPDATRNRIRIRPRIADPRGRLTASGLSFGDARVSFDIEGDEHSVSIRVRQDEGAIPATVLLEPVIAHPVTSTWIDRNPASLDVRPHGEGSMVPVQLVLDDERTLTIGLGL